MAEPGKFSPATVNMLAERAGVHCSNCDALTSGPTSEERGSINVGEAAHIYGRTKGSARYKAGLSETELSDSTNGIWLCRICHKRIDDDEQRFTADFLFQLRRQHEATISARLGRPADQLREKVQLEHLRSFENLSYLAQQIILDRPKAWEYKLTIEILRSELGPVHARWQQLKRGMYVRKLNILPVAEIANWFSAKCAEASKIISAIQPLLDDLHEAWGPPGVKGNDTAIVTVSRLIVAAATNLLEWEEDIRFVHVPNEYQELITALSGAAGQQLEEMFKIQSELSKPFEQEGFSGLHTIDLRFSLPEGWVKNIQAALKRAEKG